MSGKEEISEEIKELVIARLETLSSNKKVSIGSYGGFNKEELIEHIKKGDDIGKKMVEIDLNFLRELKKGIIREIV